MKRQEASSVEDAVFSSPLPLPLVINRELPSVENNNLPGRMELSESGQLLKSYITYVGFAGDIISNYNNFICEELPKILLARPLRVGGKLIYFVNIFIDKPKIETSTKKVDLYPVTARQRNLTYSSPLYADMVIFREEKIIARKDKVFLGKIPVMLGSRLCYLGNASDEKKLELGECPKDPLGYFIIKGIERIVFIQEKLRLNRYLIYNNKSKGIICRFTSYTPKGTTLIDVEEGKNKTIRLGLHFLGKENTMPVFLAFRILLTFYKYEQDTQRLLTLYLGFVLPFVPVKYRGKVTAVLQPSLVEMSSISDPYEYIRSLSPKEVTDEGIAKTLSDELFPQMVDQVINKLSLLALMIAQYSLYVAGLRKADDRDSVANKRFETAGISLQQLFSSLWNKSLTTTEVAIEDIYARSGMREDIIESAALQLKFNIITEGLVDTFTPGSWGIKGSYAKNNITATLDRESVVSTYAQITKINTPTRREAKQPHIRMVQMSQLGFIDFIETPEGRAVGLVKHKAIGAFSSSYDDDTIIIKQITRYLSPTRSDASSNGCLVNGKFVGWAEGKSLRAFVVSLRRKRRIPQFTSVVLYYDDILYISTEASRLVRPLLIIEDGQLIYYKKKLQGSTMQELLEAGAVEYVDAMEQDTLYIAQSLDLLNNTTNTLDNLQQKLTEAASLVDYLKERGENTEEAEKSLHLAQAYRDKFLSTYKEFTHVELDPNSLFSISASLVPLPSHNMGPRNMYTCSMLKQALGIIHSSHNLRFDPNTKMLASPAPPIFATQLQEWLGLDDLPSGNTLIVALAPYSGFNQEDAFVFKKSAIERGLFAYILYNSYHAIESKKETDVIEVFKKPPPKLRKGRDIYHALDENGIAILGMSVEEGDVVISKTRINTVTKVEEVDNVYLEMKVRGVVERVLVDKNEEGRKLVRVKIREIRYSADPVIGDKFACVLPETEVLTSSSWKKIKDLTLEDEVATLHNDEIVFMKPEKVQSYPYSGKMYKFFSREVQQTVTPNHRMYVEIKGQKRIKKAENLKGKFKLIKIDGSWSKPSLEISAKKLYELGEEAFVKEQMPIFWKMLSQPQSKVFLRGLASLKENEPWPLLTSTTSEFSDAISIIILQAGLSSIKRGNTIEICETPTEEVKIEEIVYEGDVYCCTMPAKTKGVFYMREEGKCSWTGNSRYAQKGTIGLVVPEEDMPFDPRTGIHPDIIINPLAIPSRMTIAKLFEICSSKLGALRGERINATAFNNFNIQTFRENLVQYGYSRSGTEKLIDGLTGRPIEAEIFIGPCYYLMLRHLVKNKIQIRTSNLYQPTSHQPMGGKSKGGGLRIGVMEKNAMLSHGASGAIVDSFMYRSDAYTTIFCTTCGRVAIASNKLDKPICKNCGDRADFGKASFPYSARWLTTLLAGAGIELRFKFEKK